MKPKKPVIDEQEINEALEVSVLQAEREYQHEMGFSTKIEMDAFYR